MSEKMTEKMTEKLAEIDNLLMEYRNKFDEGFPIIEFSLSKDEDEIISTIKKCLETGEPCVFDYEDGMIY